MENQDQGKEDDGNTNEFDFDFDVSAISTDAEARKKAVELLKSLGKEKEENEPDEDVNFVEMSEEEKEYDGLCEKYLESLYEGISGYVSYKPGEKEDNEKDGVFLTYGEAEWGGVRKMLKHVPVSPTDEFVDFGSGVGKLLMQTFMTTGVQRVLGLEAHKLRFEQSIKAVKQLKVDLPELFEDERKFDLVQGNFLEADLTGITIFYMCSTCFNDSLLKNIADKIKQSPSIRTVLSAKKFDECPLPFTKTIKIKASWDVSSVHIYGDAL